jgi:hypothetical protein
MSRKAQFMTAILSIHGVANSFQQKSNQDNGLRRKRRMNCLTA